VRAHTIPFGDNWQFDGRLSWGLGCECDTCGESDGNVVLSLFVKWYGVHKREIEVCQKCKGLLQGGWLDLAILAQEATCE